MNETLTSQAYEGLRAKLAQGQLKPGQRLVNRSIAKELKVSQTPLREAINRLASEGLVEYVPGAGAFIRKLGYQDLMQLYDLREQLEPYAAAQAARNIAEAELHEIQMLCDDWRRLAGEIRESADRVATERQMTRWNDNEERFHELLIRASRNRWLELMAGNLRLLAIAFSAQRGRPEMLRLHEAAITWREHVRIYRAVRDRDAERAAQLMCAHVKNGRRVVMACLRETEL